MRETLRQKVNKFIGQKFGEFVKAQIMGSNKLCQAEQDDFCAVSADGFTVAYVKQTGPVEPRKLKNAILFRYEIGDPNCAFFLDENDKKKYKILILDHNAHVVEKFYLRADLFKKAPDNIATSATYSAKFNTVTWWYDNDPIFAALLVIDK